MADRIPVSLAGHVDDADTPRRGRRSNRDATGRLQYLDAYFDELPGVRFLVARRAIAFMDAAIYEQGTRAEGRRHGHHYSEEDTWTISVECEPVRVNEVRHENTYRGIPAPADPTRPIPWQPIVSAGTIRECLLYVASLIATREQPFLSRLRVGLSGRKPSFAVDAMGFVPIRCGKYSLSVQAGRTIQCLPRAQYSDLTTYFAWEVFLPDAVRACDLAGVWAPYEYAEVCMRDLEVLFGEHFEPDDLMTRPAAFVPSAIVQRLIDALDRLGEDLGPEIALCEPLGACDRGLVCSVHRGVDPSRVRDESTAELVDRWNHTTGTLGRFEEDVANRLVDEVRETWVCEWCGGVYSEVSEDGCAAIGVGGVHRFTAPTPFLTSVVVQLNGREVLRVLPNGPEADIELDVPLLVQRGDTLLATGFYPITFGNAEPTVIDRIVIRFGLVFNVYGFQGTRPLAMGAGLIEAVPQHHDGRGGLMAFGIETGRLSSTEPNLQHVRRTPTPGPREAAHQPTYDTRPTPVRERPHLPLWNLEGDGGVDAETFVEMARRGDITRAEADALLARWNESATGQQMAEVLRRFREAPAVAEPERNVALPPRWRAPPIAAASAAAFVPGGEFVIKSAVMDTAVVHPKGPPPAPRSKRRSERAPRGRGR